MKTCGFKNLIYAYLDGELSDAKLRSFEAHLQQCPECREETEQVRGLLCDLHGMQEREAPPALQERLHAALAHEIAKGDGRMKKKLNPWALTAVAAALVVFVAVGVFASGGLLGGRKTLSGIQAQNSSMMRSSVAKSGTGASNYGIAGEPEAAATAAPAAEPPADMSKGAETPQLALADRQGPKAEDRLTKTDGRKIIYTAYLLMETREYDACVSAVDGLLARYGGYKENSQESGVPDASDPSQGRRAVIAIRMPIDRYDAAMGELRAMKGNLVTKNEYTEDVSRQYVDTQARNKTLTLQRDKLYDLLAKADTMENIIALQNEISRLTVEIEQMTAQLNFWDDKVSYSTITIELRELVTPKVIKPVDPDLNTRMNGALNNTLNNMKLGMENFAVRFVGFLPWLAVILVLLAAIAAILIPVARRVRRTAQKNAQADKPKEE